MTADAGDSIKENGCSRLANRQWMQGTMMGSGDFLTGNDAGNSQYM